MNLEDYKRLSSTLFGECSNPPRCDECTSCRVTALVGQVWESGKRSGASASKQRRASNMLIEDWEWTPALVSELIDYVQRSGPIEDIGRDDAAKFVRHQLEKMSLWAKAKDERKTDWGAALKLWMSKTWDSMSLPDSSKQGALFGDSSARPSTTLSRVEEQHRETMRQALEINSKLGRPSRCSTSSVTGSQRIPPALPSSFRTQH